MEHVITRDEVIDGILKTAKVRAQLIIRNQEIARGQYVEGNAYTWYKSLHYSDAVWAVLKDRSWRRKQARR